MAQLKYFRYKWFSCDAESILNRQKSNEEGVREKKKKKLRESKKDRLDVWRWPPATDSAPLPFQSSDRAPLKMMRRQWLG